MRGGRSIPTVPGAGDVVVGEPELTLEQAEKLLEELHAEFPVAAGLGRADGGDEGGEDPDPARWPAGDPADLGGDALREAPIFCKP